MRKLLIAVLSIAFALTGPPAHAASDNDDFDHAIDISSSVPYERISDNTTDTREVEEPDSCQPVGATQWYHLTPASSGVFAVSTKGSDFQTVIDVFSGTALSSLSSVACLAPDDYSISLTFRASAGESIYIQLGGYEDHGFGVWVPFPETPGPSPLAEHGKLSFHLRQLDPPANDDLAGATEIGSLPYSGSVSMKDASIEPDEPPFYCGGRFGAEITHSVWYRYTATVDGVLDIDTDATAFPDQVQAYKGADRWAWGFPVECTDGYSFRMMSVRLRAGDVLYLQAGTAEPDTGELSIHIEAETATAPPNDDFAHAIATDPLPDRTRFDNTRATVETGEPQPCEMAGHTVWYKVELDAHQRFWATTENTPAVIAIYSGTSLSTLDRLVCANGSMLFEAPQSGTFYVQLGAQYNSDDAAYVGVTWVQFDREYTDDMGITDLEVAPELVKTDAGDLPSATQRTVSVKVSNFGPDSLPGGDGGLLQIDACPLTTGDCDQIAWEWLDLSPGVTVERRFNWFAHGGGDYKITASFYAFEGHDPNGANNEANTVSYSIVGGIGVGAGTGRCLPFLLCL